MKNKKIYNVFFLLLLSCGKMEVGKIEGETFYNLDTVIINSKNTNFYLERSLITSDYVDEQGILYNYNSFDHSIERIDLNLLELIDKIYLDKEGPNGVSSYLSTVKIVDSETMFLSDGRQSGLYDFAGQLVKRYKWRDKLNDQEFIWQQMITSQPDSLVFGLVKNIHLNEVSLKVNKLSNNLITQFDIDPNQNYKRYGLEISDRSNYTKLDPYVFLIMENDKIFITHEFSNEIYFYNTQKDTIELIRYESKYLPSEVDLRGTENNFSSMEELQKTYENFLEQARFGILVWNEDLKNYYRLSSSKMFSNSKNEGAFLSNTIKNNVILSVFDNNFNLIKEIPLPELDSENVKYFVKDGCLWVFTNLNDDMAFVRINLEEKNKNEF